MGLQIYKRGQGRHTRLWSALSFGVIVGLGCIQLYNKLNGTIQNLWVKIFVPAGLFVGLTYLIFWLVNKPSLADFMIAAEGEMKKVSWSSRDEIVASTVIVIVVVVLMAALLGATDLVFAWMFDKII